ncbi:sugar ABC transporter substrate-binding protein [Oceanispirochaeta crateris]|uniref:Sugar ABC transporter substrate-binding protein n=1 Tax=Oceanispirochaeta crateris TaxID=2518645 RepID=A0A5C1QJQ2_9SPIO|nr:substrate-binding domain-containing protein [Oceanispirochaeta crateris]QEN08363.1 sugar ABC transporter substrate-binding protein [Oceanispirochaeta crateris]
MNKMLRGVLGLFLIAACVMPVFSNGQAEDGEKKIVVGGIVFQEDQFMRLLSIGYQDAAKDAGVKILTGNTANDQTKESELINTYVAQNVAGIAVAPLNSESSVTVLKQANDAGVLISVTNMDLSNAPYIVGGFTSDNYYLGKSVGVEAVKFIKENLDGKANIAILQFKSLIPEASTARVNGFLDEVQKLGSDITIVSDQDAWLQDAAFSTAGDMLTANPDIDIFFGANDGGTLGAVLAVKNAGLTGKAFVFGIDTGDQQITMLKSSDNILQAVCGQDPYNMGYMAMEALINAINGEDYSATKGKTEIVPGAVLNAADPAGIAAFEADMASKLK